jgi:glycosyltransferase involved in cell wall biosynthesis
MKITFVLNSIDRLGGVRVVFEHAKRLENKGHHVSVVYPAVNLAYLKRLSLGAFALWLVVSTIRRAQNLFRRNIQRPFDAQSRIIRVPTLHPRFATSIERTIPDADAILATSWETAYAVNELSDAKGEKFYFIQSYEIWDIWNDLACWKEAKRLKKGDDTCALAMAAVSPRKRRVRKTKELVDGSYKLPARKVTISPWLKRLIEEKFGEHVDSVIPDGVNFDIFFKEDDRRDAVDHITVLMPHRPERLKGFNDGLDAFAQIRARHHDTRFVVFGRKPSVNIGQLRKLPEWVEFHDNPSDVQLRALYSEAHVFVVSSWIEGFSLPPMEAMACGCAVVTTDAGGFADYIVNGETALKVPIQDPLALAESVCSLIEDDDKRRRIAEAGNKFVKQFTWQNATDKLEAILTEQR